MSTSAVTTPVPGDMEGQPQQQQQLLHELAQARAAIQTLAGQVEAQQTQLNQMSQARRDSRLSDLSGMIPTHELLRVPNQSASSSFTPIVDTRTLGKPEVFKSDPAEYSDWSFVLKSYLACISPDYIDLLDRIAGSRVSMPNRLLGETDRKLSTQLYYILVMLVKGRALDVVQNTGPGEGAEAMRRLEEMFHPRVASRFVGTLSLILNTRFSGEDLEAELEAFEKTIRRYEQESSKSIDDEMLMGIIINGIQDNSIRDHVIRNASRLTSYQSVRAELLEMSRTSRVLAQMPSPMEIGAVPQKGKKGDGKGKGKPKGKGDGKPTSSNKGNGKGKGGKPDNPHRDKECRYCKKMGHIKADCRKRMADEKAAKGKQNSQRKPNAAAPHDDEPEPLSAAVDGTLPELIAAFPNSSKHVLVDTGAGSHLFEKDFDPNATNTTKGSSSGMVTVTGETLNTGFKKKSVIAVDSGQKFSVEYCESDKINFSVLSAGQAAQCGVWTIIGPEFQALVQDKNAKDLKSILDRIPSIPLKKNRGVFWLPVKPQKGTNSIAGSTAGHDVGSSTHDVLGAVRPAAKTVPAEAYAEEGAPSGEGDVEIVAEGPQPEEVAEGPLPPIGETPEEVSEDTRKPKAKKIPDHVSKEEFNTHMLTHLPARTWCDFCMKGKVREDGHFRRPEGVNPSEVPQVSMDYCFLGRYINKTPGEATEKTVAELKTAQDDEEGALPVLVITDEKSGCIFAGVVNKGVDKYAVHLVTEALKSTGRQKVILMTDAEPSIRALAEAAAKEWGKDGKEALIQVAPRESHASNGAAERAILEVAKQARTIASALEHHFPDYKVMPNHKIYGWLIRHSAWLISRFLVKADGRTPYERLRGREYRGEIAEWAETVHYKVATTEKGKLDPQSALGLWLGKSLQSDEHLIGTEQGIRRCRTIWRRPENKRWDRKLFDNFKGTPWQPRGGPTAVPGAPGLQACQHQGHLRVTGVVFTSR